MRSGLIITLIVLGVGIVGPAQRLQANENPEAPVATGEGVNEKPRVICRRESVAGSHLRRRVCRTERELEIERLEAERIRDSDNTLQRKPTL
jgi:hypothetical protein